MNKNKYKNKKRKKHKYIWKQSNKSDHCPDLTHHLGL